MSVKCSRMVNFLLIGVSALLYPSCSGPIKDSEPRLPIEKAILDDPANYYSVDFSRFAGDTRNFPIGVFDSGTGGLTVLDAILNYDGHANETKSPGKDGLADFANEKFIYLADQANMPYGNYHSENKSALLIEHIIKDAQFLLSDKYYRDGQSQEWQSDKEVVKIIVVACNTATAYGKEYIESFLKKSGTKIHVIGVIDAGARGALDEFAIDEDGSIGVLATVGTIASNGYEKALQRYIKDAGLEGRIMVFSQGGYGIAEAVDEVNGFVNREVTVPYEDYRGPALDDSIYTIDRALLDIYNFDNSQILCEASGSDDCRIMQLNSPETYVRFHVVSLLEKIRKTPDAQPLKALLLGCTHYPYLTNEISAVLDELYHYKRQGKYVYRHVMAPDIRLIDPALKVAEELHAFMKEQKLFSAHNTIADSEFYISVPNETNPGVVTDSTGQFTHRYKYGRNAGEIQEYVKVVPFSRRNISLETLQRLKEMVPATYELVTTFNQKSMKTAFLRESVDAENRFVIR